MAPDLNNLVGAKQQRMLAALLLLLLPALASPAAGSYEERDLARRFQMVAARDGPGGWWRPVRPAPQRPAARARPLPVPVEPFASALDIERLEVNELHRERTIPNIIQCVKDFVGIITGSQTEFSAKCCVLDIFGALCKNRPPNGDLPAPAAPTTSTTTSTSTTVKPAPANGTSAAPAANATGATPSPAPASKRAARRGSRRPPRS